MAAIISKIKYRKTCRFLCIETSFGPDYFRNTERFNCKNIAAKVD
jgi:hypothetical protein